MSAPLSSIITVSIAASTANPTRQGFNTPLIASATAAWTERSRSYTTITGVGVDFATTTPEYKAAAKMFAQNPAPAKVKIGRCNGAKPTQRWAITPIAINLHKYAMQINGLDVSYTSDGTATLTEIIGGLKTAIDLLGLAITVSDQTTFMRIVANVAGVWFSVGTTIDGSPRNDPNIGVAEDHADPGMAAELDLLFAADSDWYGLITTFNSKALVDAVGAWCETNKRVYVAQTQDSACINTALSGTDDVMESTKGNALTRTEVAYSQDNADFLDAAWMGDRLPDIPGSNTWWGAQLASVNFGNYTDTQRSNILAKNGNYYEDVAAVGITSYGKVASGAFIDFIIYIDYLRARLSERIFTVLAQSRKTPYDDVGISLIGAQITAQLQEDADRGAILKGTWRVTLPKSSDIPAGGADRLARTLNGITFYAEYDDSIQIVAITGVLVP